MFDNCRFIAVLNRRLEIPDKAVDVFNGCVQIDFDVWIGLDVADQRLQKRFDRLALPGFVDMPCLTAKFGAFFNQVCSVSLLR